jgi:hypothetical protein
MTKDEALRLALEALEGADEIDCDMRDAIAAIKEALAQTEQLMSDQINYGMSVTQGGNRIDPMSIYKEREQEGECKYCTDGCPACDARKLPKQEPVQVSPLEFVEMVMEKEHLVGKPIFWAEWPNKEKNT